MSPSLPKEIEHIENLAHRFSDKIKLRNLAQIEHQAQSMPLYAVEIGCTSANAPCLILTGAIHGVERIGSQIILVYLKSLLKRASWDKRLADTLDNLKILAVPVVNPWGVALKRRSNHNGVDLMRNSPIESQNPPYHLHAGQSFSDKLPWYRGNPLQMEKELQAIDAYINGHIQSSRTCILLDLHSGFGTRDRLWFPFAQNHNPPQHLAYYYMLYHVFRKSYPHYELYQFEPQWHQYTTHGDFWDWQVMKNQDNGKHCFLPLTLELGSWLWVKKNPLQLLQFNQLFHPIKPHRVKRVQRRHSTLLDYFIQVLDSDLVVQLSPSEKQKYQRQALKLWFQ